MSIRALFAGLGATVIVAVLAGFGWLWWQVAQLTPMAWLLT